MIIPYFDTYRVVKGLITRPIQRLVAFRTVPGTIDRVDVWNAAEGNPGTIVFNLYKNGVAVWSGSDRPTLTPGLQHVAKTGLAVAVAQGDELSWNIDTVSGSDSTRLLPSFGVEVDNGFSGGGGPNDFAKRWVYGDPPDLASLTRHGSSTGSAAEDADGDVILTAPTGVGGAFEAYTKALPGSGDWTATAAFHGRLPWSEQFGGMGLVLYDSVANKSLVWQIFPIFNASSGTSRGSLTGLKTLAFLGTYQGGFPGDFPTSSDYQFSSPHAGLWYLRFRKVGATIFFDTSLDGVIWYSLHNTQSTIGAGGYITPTDVGIFVQSDGGYARFKSFTLV